MKKIELSSRTHGTHTLLLDDKDHKTLMKELSGRKVCIKTEGGANRQSLVSYFNDNGKHVLVHKFIANRVKKTRDKPMKFENGNKFDCQRKNLIAG